MRSRAHFWVWTVFFFAVAFALSLVTFGVINVPQAALAPAKILLFGSVLLALMALSNAMRERRFH